MYLGRRETIWSTEMFLSKETRTFTSPHLPLLIASADKRNTSVTPMKSFYISQIWFQKITIACGAMFWVYLGVRTWRDFLFCKVLFCCTLSLKRFVAFVSPHPWVLRVLTPRQSACLASFQSDIKNPTRVAEEGKTSGWKGWRVEDAFYSYFCT